VPRYVQTIQNSRFGKLPTVAWRLQKIATDAMILQKFSLRSTMSPTYVHALDLVNQRLAQVAATANEVLTPPKQEQLIQSLDDARSDLAAKASFAEKNPSDPFASVIVKITTRNKDKKEVSGYAVWFSSKVALQYNAEHRHFDHPSSPTSRPLPPGDYVFWTRSGSAEGPPKELRNLGIDGLLETSVDPVLAP
jgi:hypothetical protein